MKSILPLASFMPALELKLQARNGEGFYQAFLA
jgi:hypothetical protein